MSDKPVGKFKCVVCGKVCDGERLVRDPQSLGGQRWTCSDFFCGGNVVKVKDDAPLEEPKTENRITEILDEVVLTQCPDCLDMVLHLPTHDCLAKKFKPFLLKCVLCGEPLGSDGKHYLMCPKIVKKSQFPTAYYTIGLGRTIVVSDCPFCHHRHEHLQPVGEGQRTAPCNNGFYILKEKV